MVRIIQESASAKRHSRRPNFPLAGTLKPYGLYPIFIHPVLPGETLQSATVKMRTISMPVKHPLSGAWKEDWLIYVKFTDLDPDLGQMFISDTYDSSAFVAGSDDAKTFVKAGQIDWVRLALEKIHRSYFVSESETPRTIHGVPQVKLNNASWYQNMVFEAADQAVPTTDASDLYQHLAGWQMLQQMKLTELTYEDYLQQYGARPTHNRETDPEILRFARSWTLPTNQISPETGVPSSALAWSDEIKLDKAKRFNEPGFLIMLSTVRPKMFNGNLKHSMVGNMWGFSDWFPAYTLDDPTSSVKKLAKTDDVFAAAMTDAGTETLLYDHMDLLMHGEQFVNDWDGPYDLPQHSAHSVKTGANVPDLRGEYCNLADVTALWSGATEPFQKLYYEGIASAVVSGHARDNTPK
jgi:hypothetical protein